jgi:hypothetical protein
MQIAELQKSEAFDQFLPLRRQRPFLAGKLVQLQRLEQLDYQSVSVFFSNY